MDLPKKTGISGFTIVRNAVKLDYPFRESVLSLLPICDELIINCGDSTDGTYELCQALAEQAEGKIKVVQSVWDLQDTSGGNQLKFQTDTTMAYCRERWCFYLQADEVLHEKDYASILQAVAVADKREDVDGIVFDYRHFYGSCHYTISARNWYRREVRAFKNHRGIAAFRDAQGFRKNGERLKVLSANARVFHYGYVRTRESLRAKREEMSRWWGEDPAKKDQELHRLVGLRRFLGKHPKVMQDRIDGVPDDFDPRNYPRKWDRKEIKNLLTYAWEKIFRFRIGEFRNYELLKQS